MAYYTSPTGASFIYHRDGNRYALIDGEVVGASTEVIRQMLLAGVIQNEALVDGALEVDTVVGGEEEVILVGGSRMALDTIIDAAVAEAKDGMVVPLTVALQAPDTAVAAGDVGSLVSPIAGAIVGAIASLDTASGTGAVAIDVTVGGTSIFDTALTIDEGEDTSTTAATPAVLDDEAVALAVGDRIKVSVTDDGDGAKGLAVILLVKHA